MGSTKTPTNNCLIEPSTRNEMRFRENNSLLEQHDTLCIFRHLFSDQKKKSICNTMVPVQDPISSQINHSHFQHSLSPCSLQQFFYVPSRILFILNSHPLISCFCLRKVETNLNHIKILEKKLFFSQCSHFRNGSRSRRWRKEYA